MGRVQAEILNRDVRVNGLKITEEMMTLMLLYLLALRNWMQGTVNSDIHILGMEHI